MQGPQAALWWQGKHSTWQTQLLFIPPSSSLQLCHPWRCCCSLGDRAGPFSFMGTTPDVSFFFLFWAVFLSTWLSAISLAAKALAVCRLWAFAISGFYYLSHRAAVSSRSEARCRNERYLWDSRAVLLARETSMLFGMNAPLLLHHWGCHVCREFGKVACIYTGIYLNQIERLSSTAYAENGGIKSQAFSVTLSTVTIFNADALSERRCCSVNGRLRFRLVPMK